MCPRSRRSVLHATGLLALAALTGCASEAPHGSKVYFVYGHVVDEAPEDATVVEASDPRIDGNEAIQRALAEAGPESGASLDVNETTYERVEATLGRTPVYRNEPKTYANRTGLYVNASGKIVRISILESRLG